MPKYYFVRVANLEMTKEHFDELCDRLNRNRKGCHDYRLIRDFEGTPFWRSYPRLESDIHDVLRSCYEDVEETVRKFEKEKGYGPNCATVEYKHTNPED